MVRQCCGVGAGVPAGVVGAGCPGGSVAGVAGVQGLVSFGPPPVMSGTEGSVLPSTTSPVLLASFSPSFASSFCAISARCCFIRPPQPVFLVEAGALAQGDGCAFTGGIGAWVCGMRSSESKSAFATPMQTRGIVFGISSPFRGQLAIKNA